MQAATYDRDVGLHVILNNSSGESHLRDGELHSSSMSRPRHTSD